MFLTDSKDDADKVRKWSTQSRENAPWYQHEEIGYNYRMSNVIAGVVRAVRDSINCLIQNHKEDVEERVHRIVDAVLNGHYSDGFIERPLTPLKVVQSASEMTV